MKKVEDYVRSIPDFPEPGIIFRDVTSILQDADGLQLAIDEMQHFVEEVDCDVICGTESRGFIFGMPIAYNLHKPFVPIRKKGKLPCETWSICKPVYTVSCIGIARKVLFTESINALL